MAREVPGLLQQQMDTLIDIPLADWSPADRDQYRKRRALIRELRSGLEKPSARKPNEIGPTVPPWRDCLSRRPGASRARTVGFFSLSWSPLKGPRPPGRRPTEWAGSPLMAPR
jgi:hypothetical protein